MNCLNRIKLSGEYSIEEGIKFSTIKYNDVLFRVWNCRAFLYAKFENFDKSIECYNNALEINPRHITT